MTSPAKKMAAAPSAKPVKVRVGLPKYPKPNHLLALGKVVELGQLVLKEDYRCHSESDEHDEGHQTWHWLNISTQQAALASSVQTSICSLSHTHFQLSIGGKIKLPCNQCLGIDLKYLKNGKPNKWTFSTFTHSKQI